MFKKLTDKLRRLFGASGKQPAVSSAPVKKKKQKKQERVSNAGMKEVPVPPKKKKKKKLHTSANAAPAPACSAPEKPAALQEIPPCEGKTRFLDLPIHEDVQFGIQNLKFEY